MSDKETPSDAEASAAAAKCRPDGKQRRQSQMFAADVGSTTYLETLMHILKGNVGSGVFAMGDAVKNGGLLLAPALTLLMGLVCVHSQHILVRSGGGGLMRVEGMVWFGLTRQMAAYVYR